MATGYQRGKNPASHQRTEMKKCSLCDKVLPVTTMTQHMSRKHQK